MENLEVDDIQPYLFGNIHGPFMGRIGQDRHELFTTVAGAEIARPHQGLFDGLGNLSQTFVATVMAIGVIVGLEMVNVAHDDGEWLVRPVAAMEFFEDMFREA